MLPAPPMPETSMSPLDTSAIQCHTRFQGPAGPAHISFDDAADAFIALNTIDKPKHHTMMHYRPDAIRLLLATAAGGAVAVQPQHGFHIGHNVLLFSHFS